MIKLKHLITETHLRNLFHVTDYVSLSSILKDNAIKLTFVHGTRPDIEINKGFHFYLSTMRQKYGNYARNIGTVPQKQIRYPVVINLNGHALVANGFKVFSVDYWGLGPNYSEQEERVGSNGDEITPLKKYVDSIHVYIDEEVYTKNSSKSIYVTNLLELDELAHGLSIPIYFYKSEDKEYFRQQRIERAKTTIQDMFIHPELTPDELKDKDSLHRMLNSFNLKSVDTGYLRYLIDYYNGIKLNKNDETVRRFMYQLRFHPYTLVDVISSDIHTANMSHPKIFRELAAIMTKDKLETIDDLINILHKRIEANDEY